MLPEIKLKLIDCTNGYFVVYFVVQKLNK